MAAPKSQSDTSGDTASAIAEKYGVSRATVIRDGKRARGRKTSWEPYKSKTNKQGTCAFLTVTP
jgi:transposase